MTFCIFWLPYILDRESYIAVIFQSKINRSVSHLQQWIIDRWQSRAGKNGKPQLIVNVWIALSGMCKVLHFYYPFIIVTTTLWDKLPDGEDRVHPERNHGGMRFNLDVPTHSSVLLPTIRYNHCHSLTYLTGLLWRPEEGRNHVHHPDLLGGRAALNCEKQINMYNILLMNTLVTYCISFLKD